VYRDSCRGEGEEVSGIRVKCRGLTRGVAVGEALVSRQPFGFWGEVDPYTGIVTDIHHEWYGQCIAGKILIFPYGRGSTGSGGIIVEAYRRGKAPAAIVNLKTDFILLSGPLSIEVLYGGRLPVVDRPERDVFAIVKSGSIVKVDGDEGFIEIL
jgi:predicted aconitase with swiveling domain